MPAENDPDDLSVLPAHPTPDELIAAYQLCRKKLVTANRSRTALKGHDERRRILILDLQDQLKDLENSLREEAVTRMRVHELNARVAEIVKDLETGLDTTAAIVEEKSKGGLTSWVVRIARLLPLVLRLREVKARTVRLLGRDVSAIAEPLQEPEQLVLPLQVAEPAALPLLVEQPSELRSSEVDRQIDGPLLLKDLGYAYGPLLLHLNTQTVPAGLRAEPNSPWLPGHTLLVPNDPEDSNYAPIEAAILAINSETPLLPELEPWLERGVLPFARDSNLQLLRLVGLDGIEAATHVLVRQERVAPLEAVGAASLPLDLDEDLWLGFALTSEEDTDALRGLVLQRGQPRESAPRLSNRGGVRMLDNQGYLATGLGLPLLAVPRVFAPETVQLGFADGSSMTYEQAPGDDPALPRQLWQPSPQDRRRPELAKGAARFSVTEANGIRLERSIQLTPLPPRILFQRSLPLDFREDWGLNLGPLALQQPLTSMAAPSEEALQWARKRLYQGDLTVNHLFEQQMLEGLSALFQRRPSVLRRDFFQLYAQLRNKPDEWPGFPDAVLRGWCEGGWIEEGLERGNGRWRIQPIDPRLVRISGSCVQLVGLLTARGLVDVLAWAHQLGLRVQAVQPTCADMPRGWRFLGDVEPFAETSGLPLVEQAEWVPDPSQHLWTIEASLPSDRPPWPSGQNTRPASDAVCGSRGLDQHWKPSERFPERGRAPISLKIQCETSQYGKRRWHSHDPVTDLVFSSCHRNRVALHALIVATDGLWPFGFTSSETGQIDRLYDADAYLPLPIGRHAALTGAKMPGPTRRQPSDHTYRYHVDLALRSFQSKSCFLPLTSLP